MWQLSESAFYAEERACEEGRVNMKSRAMRTWPNKHNQNEYLGLFQSLNSEPLFLEHNSGMGMNLIVTEAALLPSAKIPPKASASVLLEAWAPVSIRLPLPLPWPPVSQWPNHLLLSSMTSALSIAAPVPPGPGPHHLCTH